MASATAPTETTAASTDSGTILRIKRKRGQDPVEALLIDQQRSLKRRSSAALGKPSPPQDQLTEQARRKQSRASTGDRVEVGGGEGVDDAIASQTAKKGIFRFAETVPLASFSNEVETLRLRQRVEALAKSIPGAIDDSPTHLPRSGSRSLSSSLHGASSLRYETSSSASPTEKGRDEEQQAQAGSSRGQTSRPLSRAEASASVSFRVLKKGHKAASLSRRSSSKSLRSTSAKAEAIGSRSTPSTPLHGFKRIIDVVAVSSHRESTSAHSKSASPRRSGGSADKGSRKPQSAKDLQAQTHELDGVDERFADMLGQYLQLQDLPPPTDLSQSALARFSSAAKGPESDADSSSSTSDDSDDYVYDIYYRDFTSGGLSSSMPSRAALSGDSDVGLAPATVSGHDRAASFYAGAAVPAELPPMPSYGHLAGFNDDDDASSDEDDDVGASVRAPALGRLVVDGPGLGEEWDEGEDEDSNDERFYRNEYPEGEGEGSEGPSEDSGAEEEGEDSDEWFRLTHPIGKS